MPDLAVTSSKTKAIKTELADRIIALLDGRGLTVRSAAGLAATPAADFSRIRQGKLDRFTVDRLIGILGRLDEDIEITVKLRRRDGRS